MLYAQTQPIESHDRSQTKTCAALATACPLAHAAIPFFREATLHLDIQDVQPCTLQYTNVYVCNTFCLIVLAKGPK
jgi:hypothetical protein